MFDFKCIILNRYFIKASKFNIKTRKDMKKWIHTCVVFYYCCRHLLSRFSGILSHSASFSGNNCSTVVACALMQVRYPFWTSRKKTSAQKPSSKEEARDWIVHAPVHFRYRSRHEGKNFMWYIHVYRVLWISFCNHSLL